MPAPVPIQIRYDDVGALGLAAAAVGGNEARERAVARDMAWFAAERDRQMQMQQAQASRELELLKMQQVSNLRAGSPTVSQGPTFDPAVADSIRRRNLAKQAGISDRAFAQLEAGRAYNDPTVSRQIFGSLNPPPPAPVSNAKQAYLHSIAAAYKDRLSPEVVAALTDLAYADDVDVNQFRGAVDAAIRRTPAPKPTPEITAIGREVLKGVDHEIDTLTKQLLEVDRRLLTDYPDVSMTEDLSSVLAPKPDAKASRWSQWRGTNMIPVDPAVKNLVLRRRQLQTQIDAAKKRREQMLQTPPQPDSGDPDVAANRQSSSGDPDFATVIQLLQAARQ